MKKQKYEIIYSPDVFSNLKYIEKKYWSLIKKIITEQLVYDPSHETINKKPLIKPPIDNRWELRCGPNNTFRIFYSVHESSAEVWILAVGRKVKEKLYIGGKEIKL